MDRGLECIRRAIDGGQFICIASDFDVDGVFYGYILWRGICQVGGQAYVVAPDRVQEGYGLNSRIVREAYKKGVGCILTCDNGIAAMDAVAMAKDLGMDVVITDHHEVVYEMVLDEAGAENGYISCRRPTQSLIRSGRIAAIHLKGFAALEWPGSLWNFYMKPMVCQKSEFYELLPFAAVATVAM